MVLFCFYQVNLLSESENGFFNPLRGIERSQPEVIDDQQGRFYKSFDSFLPGMICPNGHRTAQHFGCLDEEKVKSLTFRAAGQNGKRDFFRNVGSHHAHGKQRVFVVRKDARESLIPATDREVRRMEEAKELVGCSVYVNKESLEALPPGEFYEHQKVATRDWQLLTFS